MPFKIAVHKLLFDSVFALEERSSNCHGKGKTRCFATTLPDEQCPRIFSMNSLNDVKSNLGERLEPPAFSLEMVDCKEQQQQNTSAPHLNQTKPFVSHLCLHFQCQLFLTYLHLGTWGRINAVKLGLSFVRLS
ncbi:hypothetical protein CEXT_581291 [Caerostris extrusa]|uniref:Uncharacterized protein n=1 Tax=Caerostris extrusa TaxID=172846 RepID=A0AAV4XLI2_CAEEX|nr:hypothetical protein CEXT_581291 [Caerostris extrusa]